MAAEFAAGSRDPPLSIRDESAAQQLQESVENPFFAAATENVGQQRDNDGGHEGDFSAPTPPVVVVPLPAGRNQPPPAYSDAFRRPAARGSAGQAAIEVSPLLSRHSSVSTVAQQQEPSIGEHVRQQRGAVRALLLWLGIGQWYSGLCIFFSFLFLSGGIVVITLSFLTLNKLQPVKLAVVAAGIVFVLLSLLWPCGWLWNQWNRTCGFSYAPFVAYAWALSLVYTATMGALIFGVNEHYDCIHYCKNCTFELSEQYPCEFVQMSMWTVFVMLAVMAVVVFISFCYCCCNNFSCKKESQQNYNLI